MTLPSSLKKEAEKAAYEINEDNGFCDHEPQDFLAGVQWLFNKLTEAPEGKEFIQCPACGEEWSDDNWLPIAALASLRAENEAWAELANKKDERYTELAVEKLALSERVKELEEKLLNSVSISELNLCVKANNEFKVRNRELTSALEKIVQLPYKPEFRHIVLEGVQALKETK